MPKCFASIWDVGKLISSRQQEKGWGGGVISRLAVELKNELPEQMGFSIRNLQRMVQFQKEYENLFVNATPPVSHLEQAESEEPEEVGGGVRSHFTNANWKPGFSPTTS